METPFLSEFSGGNHKKNGRGKSPRPLKQDINPGKCLLTKPYLRLP